MNPELLLVETDHDVRNSADFLVIDQITKAVTDSTVSAGCSPSPGPTANH